jgi:hypothetical protein
MPATPSTPPIEWPDFVEDDRFDPLEPVGPFERTYYFLDHYDGTVVMYHLDTDSFVAANPRGQTYKLDTGAWQAPDTHDKAMREAERLLALRYEKGVDDLRDGLIESDIWAIKRGQALKRQHDSE